MLPPLVERMAGLGMHTCDKAALACIPAPASLHEARECSRILPRLSSTHVDARHACSSASGLSEAGGPLQVMWCCGTTRCTTHTTRRTRGLQSVHLPLGWTTTPQVPLCCAGAQHVLTLALDGQGTDARRVLPSFWSVLRCGQKRLNGGACMAKSHHVPTEGSWDGWQEAQAGKAGFDGLSGIMDKHLI